MKSKAILFGHPAHPMLLPFPLAFLTGAFLFDAAGWLLGNPAWWATGSHLAPLGVATALLAAVPGFVDYLYTVPPRSSGRKRATRHMAANLTAVTLFAMAWVIRGELATGPTIGVVAIETIGVLVLAAGGYMGGTLVTRNMISVDHRYAEAGKWHDESIAGSPGEMVTVGSRDDLKVDQMKLLRVGDRRIVLARTERGYVAFDDHCTHRGGSLADGVMICGTVQCLWHGSQFDVANGQVKAGPATDPISVYEVKEERDTVTLVLPRG